MKFEMRELMGDDLFVLLNIISRLGIKEDIVKMFQGSAELVSTQQVETLKKKHKGDDAALEKALNELLTKAFEGRGMAMMAELLIRVLENLIHVKDDLNKLLADVCAVDIKTIKELGLKDYTELVVGFFKKPDLVDFMRLLASLIK